jgi:hypothetical protein
MKKYLFGLFAIALAVSFSAFTNVKKTTKSSTVYENWYETDGTFVTGILYDANNGSAIDRDDLIIFLESEPCEGNSEVPCVRGSDDEVVVTAALPAEGTESDFKKP